MKIIILCLSEGIGGLELYTVREYQALTDKGVECIPIVAEGSLLDQRFKEEGVQPQYLTVSQRKFPFIAAKKLADLIASEQVDLVHMHWAKDLHLAALAKKRANSAFKLIYTRHMSITRPKRDLLHRFLYRELDALWVITEAMKREALEYLPIEADRVIRGYLGVRAPEGELAPPEAFFEQAGFNRRKLNIALFGRIEHDKGQHVLIEALGQLAGQCDISATLVGHVMDKGYQQQQQARIEALGLADHIRFLGFVDNPINAMGCFDLVILTTFKETFGLVLPEAMRAGVAVIGTDAGGVPEIIDDGVNGLLVRPADPQALAAAIKRLYQDEEHRRALANAGREKADLQFNEQHHFEALYQRIRQFMSVSDAHAVRDL